MLGVVSCLMADFSMRWHEQLFGQADHDTGPTPSSWMSWSGETTRRLEASLRLEASVLFKNLSPENTVLGAQAGWASLFVITVCVLFLFRKALYTMVKYKYNQYTDTPSVTRPVGFHRGWWFAAGEEWLP